MRIYRAIVLVLALASAFSAYAQNHASFTMDTKQSKVEVHVYREGFLKAFGHDHQISATEFSGKVQVGEADLSESSVTFVVQTKSLVVLDPRESEKLGGMPNKEPRGCEFD